MGAENATTMEPVAQAAISQKEMNERNFSIPMSDTEDVEVDEASRRGQPKPQPKEEVIPDKFRGKSQAEIARSAQEAERKMHEATQETRSLQERLSQSEAARLRYEQMLTERSTPAPRQDNSIRDDFKKFVNDDDKVLNTVEGLAGHKAREEVSKIDPRIQSIERSNKLNRAQLFNLNLQTKVSLDPELGKLLPEIRQEAAMQLDYIAGNMLSRGMDPNQVKDFIEDLNYDMSFMDSCHKKVLGSKGKDYWSGVLNPQPTSDVNDEAKIHLGGASSNPDEGDQSNESLLKMAANPGGSDEMRKELVKQGLLRDKRTLRRK